MAVDLFGNGPDSLSLSLSYISRSGTLFEKTCRRLCVEAQVIEKKKKRANAARGWSCGTGRTTH